MAFSSSPSSTSSFLSTIDSPPNGKPLSVDSSTLISSLSSASLMMEMTPASPSKHIQLSLSYQGIHWGFQVLPGQEYSIVLHIKTFATHLAQRQIDDEEVFGISIDSSLTLAASFLGYLSGPRIPRDTLRIALQEFENDFLFDNDIHTLALGLINSSQVSLLKIYYGALGAIIGYSGRCNEQALLEAARKGDAQLFAMFGGQGSVNLTCLANLSELHSIYTGFLKDLIDVAAHTLNKLVSLPKTLNHFENYGFDIKKWLENAETIPCDSYIASAPLSFPIIGLLSLAHYCITCKVAGKHPGELRNSIHGLTGHCQGIIVAAGISRSGSWDEFYDSVKLVMEMLFWIGIESHHATLGSAVSTAAIKDSIQSGEGQPSHMLSVRGLDQQSLQAVIGETNIYLGKQDQIFLAAINSRDSMVLSGRPNSLRGLNLRLRKLKADDGLEQSRLPFNERKPAVQHHYLPVSAPFHTVHLENAVSKVLKALQSKRFSGNDLRTAVYNSSTAEDLRELGSQDLIEVLVRLVMTEPVDWPRASSFSTASHILDFGPGRLGALVHQMKEGTGIRVIVASELSTFSEAVGSKQEIFASSMPSTPPNWGDLYGPRLVEDAEGNLNIETKMTKIFGTPPVMIAGMTPTTVPWDFVNAIMCAGYHVELAGGGYFRAKDFENAIQKISENIPSHVAITCNLIYATPRAIAWQIPLIRKLIRKGFRIDGLTIGAGIPSAEVVKEYIENLGLRHLSFKPGSHRSILEVVDIAKSHPNFPIGLQWTGGRGGGHHSFEDFHAPILTNYGRIRECANIILIAGSGFGGPNDTYPYLTGEWSQTFGFPKMPFDGVLLGSRMMVAKEAHTSSPAKALIVRTSGVADSEWHKSYQEVTGGVVTVTSEMGQPIHKIATRGVLFWKYLDEKIFSIKNKSRRLAELQKNKTDIIDRLNKDFQKPWFGVNSAGHIVEIHEMTYVEVLKRLIALMYVHHQKRWIDASYEKLVLEFAERATERLLMAKDFILGSRLQNPLNFLAAFLRCYPTAKSEFIHPDDELFFVELCRRRGQKPVNFIPRLDEDFETWFKKDSLWQAEDIDAVVDQDIQRVCIIHGPVAARHSQVVDEPCRSILDNIVKAHVKMLYHDLNCDKTAVARNVPKCNVVVAPHGFDSTAVDYLPGERIYRLSKSGTLPDLETLSKHMSGGRVSWATVCLTTKSIIHGQYHQNNPIRAAFSPRHGYIITVRYDNVGEIESVRLGSQCSSAAPVLRTHMIISSYDGKTVSAFLCQPRAHRAENLTLEFKYEYSGDPHCKLSEHLFQRNARIKKFYADLWLGNSSFSFTSGGLHSKFFGAPVTISRTSVLDFMNVIGYSDCLQNIQESVEDSVPLDYSIVIAWDAIVRPLLIPGVQGDLLRLLHKSNEFEYLHESEPLKIGETVETTSQLEAITIKPNGKLVRVMAEICRNGTPTVRVVSTFIIQGSFSDYENTFRCTREPEMEVVINSNKIQVLLFSRAWLKAEQPFSDLVGSTLVFKLRTQVTFDQAESFTSLQVIGTVHRKNKSGMMESIGKVFFESGLCHGNPVMDFLSRYGSVSHEPQKLAVPGWQGDSSWRIRMPNQNDPYARASKDTNPIHVSPVFAQFAHLQGTVTHGMYTSGAVRRVVERSASEANPTRFRRYFASFEGMVLPGDELRVEMQHVAMVAGRMLLKIQAYNNNSGDKVLDAEAEIEQPPIAYMFTGQGSQEKGMGMALYDASPAAKDIWDRGDRHLFDLYGFSILDIVRHDPKELTVHFGGQRGRKLRENYLAITTEKLSSNGQVVVEPMIRGLTQKSTSYTFTDVRGLLYSTQFAQPALVLMELAVFEDIKSKELIQQGAAFAGHSLGEYAVLGAFGNIMSVESLLSLVFYRGLVMQVTMQRDEYGHTNFSMVAVNPSRVGGGFNQDNLEELVKLISQETQVLLEVVNYNVEGQQYVCAGHLLALWVLTEVLNQYSHGQGMKLFEPIELIHSIRECISHSPDTSSRIKLQRGIATMPLSGIDVPFHSTHLQGGIGSYRKFLQGRILEENVDPDKLVDKFIPNVIGKPFSVDREYVEEVEKITGSIILKQMLETWVEDRA